MGNRKKDVFYEAMDKWEQTHEWKKKMYEVASIATYFHDYAFDAQQKIIDKLEQEIEDRKMSETRLSKRVEQIVNMLQEVTK